MVEKGFVHLHLHTEYSLLDGSIRIGALLDKMKEWKMKAAAITDHGNMFGAVEFYNAFDQQGLKPILGAEVYVAPASRFEKRSHGIAEASYHLVLLVQDEEGYRNLCKLVSAGYLEGFYYRPRVDKDLLASHQKGLIALSACLAGEIPSLILRGEHDKALKVAAEYSELFDQGRFYLEIQDNGLPDQKRVNKTLLQFSKRLGVPLVATNDCHYLQPEDAKSHDILLCIQTNKTVDDKDRLRFQTDQFYVKSPEEMWAAFGHVPEALANTVEIAERCEYRMQFGTYRYPKFEIPEGETLDSFLGKLAASGLEARLEERRSRTGAAIEPASRSSYQERLEHELSIIREMGYAGYFLIVYDFIRHAKARGIPVGPGRGSAAGSLVAYALGITSIDPLEYNLIFERFLNTERISMPDIDVDFCEQRREEVIRYVVEKYGGEKNVARIITFGTMKARAAVRDVGRALGVPYSEVDRVAKLIPEGPGVRLEAVLSEEPRLAEEVKKDSRIKEVFENARKLEGLVRHASTHAAGLVISSESLEGITPLYRDPRTGVVSTQFSMKPLEKLGLIKFDFLGLKTLTVIAKAVELIRRNRNVSIDLESLPLDDKKTYQLLAAGETDGIFQLESSGMRELLVQLRPETFEEIIALVALYRPGPLGSNMVADYIRRKHGREENKYLLPQLREILEETYGVIVYQEQVMKIATSLAGFTMGEADVLRAAMSKKVKSEMLRHKERFLRGAKKKGIPAAKAREIYGLIEKFGEYGFNKSHSTAYALVAYQTAYLKAHYPVEYMAALLSFEKDKTDKILLYISACRKMQIQIQPPDINLSSVDFTVAGDEIRFGLGAVKNVGEAALEAIIQAREGGGPFRSFEDFCNRVDSRRVNRRVVESLIKCGAFDSITSGHRAQLLSILDEALESGSRYQEEKQIGQIGLFEGMTAADEFSDRKPLPDVPEWSTPERLSFEKESLGIYLSGHPLQEFEEDLRRHGAVTTRALAEMRESGEVAVGGFIAARKEVKTRKDERMSFVTLEDEEGRVEVVIFPDVHKQCAHLLEEGRGVLVRGRLEVPEQDEEPEEEGRGGEERKRRAKVLASSLVPLEELRAARDRSVHVTLTTEEATRARLEELRDIVLDFKGSCPVFLHLLEPAGSETTLEIPSRFHVQPCGEFLDRIERLFGHKVVHVQ